MYNVEEINLYNKSGVNRDARGVRDVDWKLHFWNKYTCYNSITFHDLIVAAYKIRSHKFENNYELFCDVKTYVFSSNGKYTINIFAEFDHGS